MNANRIIKTNLKNRSGSNYNHECNLITDMRRGASDIEVILTIKLRMPTDRIDRINRLWGSLADYSFNVQDRLHDMLNPTGIDNYELTEKGINSDD